MTSNRSIWSRNGSTFSNRSRRADRQTAGRTGRSNALQGPANIIIGFDVDCNIACVWNESGKKMIGPFDHEVGIQRNGRDFCNRFHNGRSKRNIIHEMAVHHVEVKPIRACFFHPFAFRAQDD